MFLLCALSGGAIFNYEVFESSSSVVESHGIGVGDPEVKRDEAKSHNICGGRMTISLTSFAIGACAVWRVAHLIACEDGPGDILFLIRQRLGQGFAGRLIDCFDCVSIWISALALLIRASWDERIIMWIGISGAACLLERISVRNRGAVTEDVGGMKNAMLWREKSSAQTASEDAAKL
jgi:hypothetical protein